MSSIPDQHERSQALDIRQSYICEAPAGSGKTELLTQRLLALLANVDQPEEVLAITFTRKAAAEMRKRVVDALSLAQTTEAPDESHRRQTWELARKLKQRDEQKNWQLLHNSQRLRIQTFDSFCAYLTRQLPLHAVLGSGLRVSEDSDELYTDAVENFLHELETDSPFQETIALLLLHLDNKLDKLAALLVDLLKKRDAWLDVLGGSPLEDAHRNLLESHLQHVIDDKVEQVKAVFPEDQVSGLLTLCKFAARNLRDSGVSSPLDVFVDDANNDQLPGSTPKALNEWQAINFLLLTSAGEPRKQVTVKQGFPPGGKGEEGQRNKDAKAHMLSLLAILRERPALVEALQELLHLPRHTYQENQWQVLNALTSLLPRLVAYLHLTFKEHSTVDFNEIALRATQALGDDLQPSDLALRLDYQIRHILVDEFQDSSISQIHLLKQLTRGWQAGDGRTLFCVGDAMQSIYGFRGANVGLFLYAKQQGIGELQLKPLQLSTNFRSQAGLVDWVNIVFQHAFPNNADITQGAVPYSPAQAIHPGLSEAAVKVHGFGEGTSKCDEGQCIVDIIRKERTENNNTSIAILVRNRQHAAHILPLLKEANLPYRAVDLQVLTEKVIVQDLLSLTRALLHPGDKLAWFALLRAPWCGLKLLDLETISRSKISSGPLSTRQQMVRCLAFSKQSIIGQSTKRQSITGQSTTGQSTTEQGDLFAQPVFNEFGETENSLSPDACARIERVLTVIDCYLENRQRLPLRAWVEGCWFELGGPACLQNEEDRENAEAFFTMLEEQDQHGSLESFEHFEKRLEKLFAQPDPRADESLQIMTIHKSKGLEFDVVILPSLHSGQRPNQPELFLWQTRLRPQGDEELLFAPITETGKDTDATYNHLQVQNRKKDRLENCRLLYVACTRAKKHLHLCASVSFDKKGDAAPPAKNAMLHYIWPSISDEIDILTRDNAEVSDESANKKPLRRLPTDFRVPALPEKHLLAPYIADYNFDNTAVSSDANLEEIAHNTPANAVNATSPLARHCGSLIHQILQEMCETGLMTWQKTYRKETLKTQQNWQARLLSLGLPPALIEDALLRTENCIEKIVLDTNIQWMLGDDLLEKHSEFALCLHNRGDRLNTYIIDLLVVDKDKTTWIIDYKTSEPAEGESLETFIEREKQNYALIMSQYRRAIEGLGYEAIRSALYFPFIQAWGFYDS